MSILIKKFLVPSSHFANCVRNASKIASVLDGAPPLLSSHVRLANLEKSKALEDVYHKNLNRALAGGGKRGIDRHVNRNKKMLVRDRIKLLVDPGSPVLETSIFAGLDQEYGDVPCAGVVTAIGKVNGTWSVIIANDATVRAGTIYPITLQKNIRAQEIAEENNLPVIYLVDSGGAYLPLQSQVFNEGGRTFFNQANMSSKGIPQVSVVCGSCTAGAAYIPAMSDETVILDKSGTIFLGGPPLVFAATGERVTPEQLGGATLHCDVSGVTDHFASTEEEAILKARDIMGSLNLPELPDSSECEAPKYSTDHLSEYAPCGDFGYQLDGRLTLSCILDGSRFHEFKARFGKTLVTGFGFVEGQLAGFVVSNGRFTGSAAKKCTHFVQLCNQRKLPIVFLQNLSDDRGVTKDNMSPSESAELVRGRAQLMQAVACSEVPSMVITTGGTTGSLDMHAVGSLAMGARFHFTYPNVKVLGSGGSLESTTEEIAAEEFGNDNTSPEYHTRKLEIYEDLLRKTDAFTAAKNMITDGVILPRDTRTVIGNCLNIFRHDSMMKAQLQQIPQQAMIRM